MNSWFKLLYAFKEQKFPNYFYGLSPRFIVGACQIPMGSKIENAEEAYEITKRLFEGMERYNSGGYIVVSNQCDIHSGPVMSLREANWTKEAIGTNFDEIWKRYGNEIIEGNFNIDAEERKILESIFNENSPQ